MAASGSNIRGSEYGTSLHGFHLMVHVKMVSSIYIVELELAKHIQ